MYVSFSIIDPKYYFFHRILVDTGNILRKVYNVSEWKNYLDYLKEKILFSSSEDECPAKEVMLFVEPNGYFSGSPEPRTDRSKVKFRIGQVIKHKRFGYRGVIVGWDTKAKVCFKIECFTTTYTIP